MAKQKLRVLIPLLSRQENEEAFLDKALQGANEVTLLVVVDASSTIENFGFTTSQIGQCNSLMNSIKEIANGKKIKIYEALEWGDTFAKVENTAKLRKVDRIVLKKQENHYFEELVRKLRDEKFEVEVI